VEGLDLGEAGLDPALGGVEGLDLGEAGLLGLLGEAAFLSAAAAAGGEAAGLALAFAFGAID
jgi:hypothetical protein